MTTPKFCFVCGKALKRGYPGGDPENGPAEMRCPDPDAHPTLEEAQEHQHWSLNQTMQFAVELLRRNLSMHPFKLPERLELEGATILAQLKSLRSQISSVEAKVDQYVEQQWHAQGMYDEKDE